MIIAVTSGKGGTGKTTVALSLARVMTGAVEFLDCDVEAPNAHLFLHPDIEDSEEVGVLVPVVDPERCDNCGECSSLCAFNAILSLGSRAVVFPELCHGCGGCIRVCPNGALGETMRPIGIVESGRAGHLRFVHGRLEVGEALVPPLIDAVRRHSWGSGRPEVTIDTTIIDSPPGTSCSMIAAIRGSDYALLVTEPTPFGLNDLELAVGACQILGVDFGVVINRAGIGDGRVREFCAQRFIPILAEIPDDRRVAEAVARGHVVADHLPEMRRLFVEIAARIRNAVKRKSGVCDWEAV